MITEKGEKKLRIEFKDNENGTVNEIQLARKTMREAFEKDAEFKHSYICNVAVIIYHHFGTKHDAKEAIAEKILDRIFSV